MSTTRPSSSSSARRNAGVDDVRRAVQPLRRTEDLAGEAVRDHHVVADRHAEHRLTPRRRRSCGTAPAAGRRRAAPSPGQVVERRRPGEQRVERRVAQQVQGEREPVRGWSASRGGPARPCRPGWRGCPAGGSGRRRRAQLTSRSPYQLSSSTVPSARSRSSDSCSPAAVALAWTTRSRSAGGVLRRGEAARRAGRPPPPGAGSMSTRSTSTPGIRASSRATQQPTMPAPTTVTRSPTSGGASHSALTAVSTVPASTARRAGTSSGTGTTASAGTTYARLVRVEAEDGAPEQVGGSALDHADVEVAVLHRAREVAVLERRAHRVALARRAPRRGRPASRCRG